MHKPSERPYFPVLGQFHYLWMAVLVLASVFASIQPLEFIAYLMHQAGTVVFVGLLFWLVKQQRVSKLAFALSIVFLLIHVVGAHYLYSYVPYQHWFDALGLPIPATTRNMYDRLVHLSYGLLLYRLFTDVFSTWFFPYSTRKIGLLAIQFIMASSMFYELIEWWIANGMSPEAAENYNGQQGDFWDAQKDMAIAMLGAIIAYIIDLYFLKRKTI